MTSKLVAVIGAGLLAGVCVCVDAAVLCKGTRSASLKVRDVCKSYETQVDPLSLSACRAHPVVRDGNGTFVGCLVSDRNGGEVLQRDISGVKVWFYADINSGILGGVVFIHTQPDCSDPPQFNGGTFPVPGPLNSTKEAVYGGIQGTLVYYPTGEATYIHNPPAISYNNINDATCATYGGTRTPSGLCCVPQSYCEGCGSLTGVAPYATADIGVVFAPPFLIEGE